MLMSTGCLAPLAPMVIPGSQYSNFYCNIFIVIIYCLARVSTKLIKIVVVVVVVVVNRISYHWS